MSYDAFLDEISKLAAAKSNFSVPQSRKGRRSMSVATLLRKEKNGTLYKHKLASALSGDDDEIPGGTADDMEPGDFDTMQLKKGITVEMEHTNDPNLAREIAMDHLTESSDYYDELEQMEEGMKTSASTEEEEFLGLRDKGPPTASAGDMGAATALGGLGGALAGKRLVGSRLVGAGAGALVGAGVYGHNQQKKEKAWNQEMGSKLDKAIGAGMAEPDWFGPKVEKKAHVPPDMSELRGWAKLATVSIQEVIPIKKERKPAVPASPALSKTKDGDMPDADMEGAYKTRFDANFGHSGSAIPAKEASAVLGDAIKRTLDENVGLLPDRETPTARTGERHYHVGSSPDPRPITEVESDDVGLRT